MKTLLLATVAAALASCASGSALIVGQARSAIENHTTVRILAEMPDGAEKIAIVKASSDAGWNQQQSLDYAVEELKKQAAKVGANAVVLTDRDTSSQVYGDRDVVTSSEVEIVQGMAIWVDPGSKQ